MRLLSGGQIIFGLTRVGVDIIRWRLNVDDAGDDLKNNWLLASDPLNSPFELPVENCCGS